MSKTCNECGCQMDDNAQACPQCGCPAEDASTSAFMDADILNEGKSTEAESTITDYAYCVLKWGNILAILNFVIIVIYGVGCCGFYLAVHPYFEITELLVCLIVIAVFAGLGFLSYIIVKFIAKLIWATIMLFVNISTTLKRIEIKLEENGTR